MAAETERLLVVHDVMDNQCTCGRVKITIVMTRRAFLRSAAAACLQSAVAPAAGASARLALDDRRRPAIQRDVRPRLADDFPDLRRHFVFEYYPWYRANPYSHWDQWDRRPPVDIASNFMPRLGPYDSRSTAVLEQHARWIADTGVGAINVSWWGPGSSEDQFVPRLMDVMAAHDIHVTFHIEPYSDTRGFSYARDIQYLITEYGDRRRWDCFLLLEDADGTVAPVFKSFATILPPQGIDCHGTTVSIPGYTPDGGWHQQTDRVRDLFRRDFDRVTMLADSLAVDRVQTGGFDGIAIYDNFVHPDTWLRHARNCTARNLLFFFNTNPGFDSIAERRVDPASCYRPPGFEPPSADSYDWGRASDRERAERASAARINDSFHTTLSVQRAAALSNAKRGFFLMYINSFNEWHEGHQFEPMKNAAELTAEERAVGYHNPSDGGYRLSLLNKLLHDVLE